MNTYLFETHTTMKPHNSEKWWIMNDIVPRITVEAASVSEALEKWRGIVNDKSGVEVSENAIRCKHGMYHDTKDGGSRQVGYVITGKSLFDKGDYTGYSTQYVDLWVNINILTSAF